jgi:hypothetical protein
MRAPSARAVQPVGDHRGRVTLSVPGRPGSSSRRARHEPDMPSYVHETTTWHPPSTAGVRSLVDMLPAPVHRADRSAGSCAVTCVDADDIRLASPVTGPVTVPAHGCSSRPCPLSHISHFRPSLSEFRTVFARFVTFYPCETPALSRISPWERRRQRAWHARATATAPSLRRDRVRNCANAYAIATPKAPSRTRTLTAPSPSRAAAVTLFASEPELLE